MPTAAFGLGLQRRAEIHLKQDRAMIEVSEWPHGVPSECHKEIACSYRQQGSAQKVSKSVEKKKYQNGIKKVSDVLETERRRAPK